MLNWLRIIILLIAGILVSLRLFLAPECVYINGIKMKYTPFKYTTWESYLHEQTKGWNDTILRDRSFHEQPLETRVRVAKNYYSREIATKLDVLNQPPEMKERLRKYVENTAKVTGVYTFRRIFPEYDDLSDEDIKKRMYEKFYEKDMSQEEFNESFLNDVSQSNIHGIVRIAGPHNSMMPSKDITTVAIHSTGIAVLAATL